MFWFFVVVAAVVVMVVLGDAAKVVTVASIDRNLTTPRLCGAGNNSRPRSGAPLR